MAWHHVFDRNVYYYRKNHVLYENSKNSSRYYRLLLIFCRSSVCHFFNVQFVRCWKSKNIWDCMHTFIQESCPVVFSHFSVSLAACVINILLEHSLYIDINKNIISYFNSVKIMLFVILFLIFGKKNTPHFLYILETDRG